MSQKHPFIRGALILTLTGFLSRIIGFFYRVFLSHTIGAEGLGLYQLIFPIQTLCMALTTAGIQTAISRFVAAKSALKDNNGANDMFLGGCGLSLVLSIAAAWLLRKNAGFISQVFLTEPRCEPLLHLMALGLPLSTIHSCITSYYFARKETAVPSGIQLLEQVVRVGSSWLVCQIFLSEGREITPVIAVVGMIASELSASFVSLLLMSGKLRGQNYRLTSLAAPCSHLGQILTMALPLTANRVLLTLLTSVETILIPNRLRVFGLGASEALSVYGVLTGMALPLILFPSTITNSVAVMLLPSVAELQALGNQKKIRQTTHTIIRCCLGLGVICTLGFFTFSHFLGTTLFHSPMASEFVRPLAFICPFLYLNTTVSSILNGLGKTSVCFVHNVASVAVRLSFVVLGIPVFGITGYLWGILLGELLLCLLNCRALYRYLQR
ncbi:MAG: oligosaccharide flippase family protein [Blautia sp.]